MLNILQQVANRVGQPADLPVAQLDRSILRVLLLAASSGILSLGLRANSGRVLFLDFVLGGRGL